MIRRVALTVATGALLLSSCAPQPGTPSVPTSSGPVTTFGVWKLWDPADPDAPALLEAGTDGYHLKPDWQIGSIEYVYGWWGLGAPGEGHQLIKRDGSSYKRGNDTVPDEDVQTLIKALDRLYPTQLLLSHTAWTDDYPHWSVEITGSDGEHILLDSSSTGNPGNGPWNVLYNGRLYAQYDGSIGAALGKLFGGRLAEKEGNPFGPDPSGKVRFSSGGLPPQLIYGFWGLVPIASGFSYGTDPAKGEITGQVTGRSRIGRMQRGEIDKLSSVKLRPEGKDEVQCKIEDLPEGDPFAPVTRWKFTCYVGVAQEGERYRIPISVEFGTEKGSTSQVAGELSGTWGSHEDLEINMPPPAEWSEALSTKASATDLLSDHYLSHLLYEGELDPAKPSDATLRGEAILLGQSEVNGKRVKYTVGTPFVIEKRSFAYWELDRAILSSLLQSIGKLPTTTRVVQASPDTVINMWYAKDVPPGERFQNYAGTRYQVKVNPCGQVPGAFLPSAGKPLLAFGYDLDRSFDRPDFVLIDGKPAISDLDLFPLSPEPPSRKALLPAAFDTGTSRPFQRVWVQGSSIFEHIDNRDKLLPGGTVLTLYIPQDSTSDEKKVYEKIAGALPGSLEMDEAWWTVSGVTFVPNDDGSLRVVGCADK